MNHITFRAGLDLEPVPVAVVAAEEPQAEPQAEPTPMSAAEKSTLVNEAASFSEQYPDATFDDLLQGAATAGFSEADLKTIGIVRSQYN
jgi:hypothetical protein